MNIVLRKSFQSMKKLYVIIDEKLDPIYGCVQGGHAVAGYCKQYCNGYWDNNYLIYSKAPLDDIYALMYESSENGSRYYAWRESDLDGEYTAIAIDNSLLLANGENYLDNKLKCYKLR